MRAGEKLREYLFLEDEDYETTQHEKIFVSKAQPPLEGGPLHHAVQHLIRLAQDGAPKSEIWAAIQAIAPECQVPPTEPALPQRPDNHRPPRLRSASTTEDWLSDRLLPEAYGE